MMQALQDMRFNGLTRVLQQMGRGHSSNTHHDIQDMRRFRLVLTYLQQIASTSP